MTIPKQGCILEAMRIIKRKTLQDFYQKHSDAKRSLDAWYNCVKHHDFGSPAEVRQVFRSADIVGDNRMIFNIKGNHYRLIVKFHFNTKLAYIRFIGTHAEYDKVDPEVV